MSDNSLNPQPDPTFSKVVLIHGFGRRALSMRLMARRLRALGFECTRVSYSSWHTSLARSEAIVLGQIKAKGLYDFHIIGHSFGGLIALRLKQEHPDLRVQRVVQMGTPNLGSNAVEHWHRVKLVRSLFGPVVDDLRQGGVTPRGEEPDLLAIAGTGFPTRLARIYGVHGPNDALVDEVSAYGTAAAHHARVSAVHGWLPMSKKVVILAAHFLRTGEVLDQR